MSTRLRALAAVAATAVLSASAAAIGSGVLSASAHPTPFAKAYGLTSDQRLGTFTLWSAGFTRQPRAITGLTPGDPLVGIDVRPENDTLIGLSRAGRVFVIDPITNAATMLSQLDTALVGTHFGIDFNPTVDRLRIVSDTGQNLRANVDTGVVTSDAGLSYTQPTPASGVTAIAYTNNDSVAMTATGTVLYDLDTTLDRLAIQMPPNSGQLNVVGLFGQDVPAGIGFDILTRSTGHHGASNTGWVVTGAMLHEVNLESGQVLKGWKFRNGIEMVDLAVHQ